MARLHTRSTSPSKSDTISPSSSSGSSIPSYWTGVQTLSPPSCTESKYNLRYLRVATCKWAHQTYDAPYGRRHMRPVSTIDGWSRLANMLPCVVHTWPHAFFHYRPPPLLVLGTNEQRDGNQTNPDCAPFTPLFSPFQSLCRRCCW
jgi:hypothetical protein